MKRYIPILMTLAGACLLLLSCATAQESSDSFLFVKATSLDHPVDAWLHSLQIVSDQLPLSSEYPLIEEAYAAVASRYGFKLSTQHTGQPYIIDISIQGRSFTTDLSTREAVLGVLDLKNSQSGSEARVIYSATSQHTVQSLHYVYRMGETLFASLRKTIGTDAKRERENQNGSHSSTSGS